MAKLRNRKFDLGALLVLLATLLLVICSCGQGNQASVPFNSFVGGTEFILGESNRFPFAIVSLDGQELAGADIMVDFYYVDSGREDFKFSKRAEPLDIGLSTKHVHDDETIHVHSDMKNLYVVQNAEFDVSGYWESRFRVHSLDGIKPMPSNLAFHVLTQPLAVSIGQSVPIIDNRPNNGDSSNQGVNFRDMQAYSIGEAISSGKPFLVIWASPLFCMSKLCSPVIEEVVAIKALYEDRIRFIHIEPWNVDVARETGVLQFTENAKIWGLHSEPWVYLVNKYGIVVDRFEGPVSSEELEYSINSLLSLG